MKLKGEIHLFLIRLAFLLVFLWVLFGLLFGITTMKNNDMSPRISAGDLLFYYRLEKPKSGDVVVLQKAGEKYVGRVIAAGGDTVEITEYVDLGGVDRYIKLCYMKNSDFISLV